MQRKTYNKPTHIAQTEEPWSRLHDKATFASTQRSVTPYEVQVSTREGGNLTFIYEIKQIFEGECTFCILNTPLFWPQAPNDSLDFQLRSVYDHNKDFFWSKNQMLYQRKTLSENLRWLFVMFVIDWLHNFTVLVVALQESNWTVLN